MNSIIRFSSNQGTFDLTSAKSVVDIDIPANIGNVDLSESYVSIITNTDLVVAVERAAKGGVNNPYIKYNLDSDNDLHISDTAALVSNANFSSNRFGRIEDVRRVSLLKNTLSCYKNDLAQVQSNPNKLSSFDFSKADPAHQNSEISRFEDIKSEKRNHEIHIPLRNIFNSCKSEGYDTSNNQSRIHLEMKFKDLAIGTNAVIGAATIEGTADLFRDFNDVQPDASGVTRLFLTSSKAYKNDSNVPWYVGQYVRIGGTKAVADTGAFALDTVIASITRDDNNTCTLHFLDAIVLAANSKLETITVQNNVTVDATNSSLSILGVELVASISNEAPPKQLNYTTFDSEEDSYPATISCNRQYQVPPACKNVYVMFFNSTDDKKQRSDVSDLDNYRMTLDNRELTPRPIAFGSRVHKDLIQQVFVNNGDILKNLRETQMANGAQADVNDLDNVKNSMIAFPIQFKNSPTQLQLEINAKATKTLSGHHILFYERVVQK